MKRISVQDLKAGLSAAIAAAEAGETLIITRHNEPVAHLTPARTTGVHRGAAVGSQLKPALAEPATDGAYLAALLDDRGDL